METIGKFEKCFQCSKFIWRDEKPKEFFEAMPSLLSKRVLLKFNEFIKFSSKRQRGYFHAVIVRAYAEASGLDTASAYESLMTHFYPVEFMCPIQKKIIHTRRSYLDLSTKEAEELHTHSRILLNEYYSIIVPLPNEPWGVYG